MMEAKVTLSDAISAAQKEVPGGKAVDADLVTAADGKVIYSIELMKDDVHKLHKVSVDMQNGSVINVTQKNVAAKDLKRVGAVEQAKVTMVDAIAAAQKQLTGGIVAAAEAKVRKGQVVYVVDDKNVVHSRQIEVAHALPHLFVLAGGVSDSDRLLIDGLRKVRDGNEIVAEFQPAAEVLAHLDVPAQ